LQPLSLALQVDHVLLHLLLLKLYLYVYIVHQTVFFLLVVLIMPAIVYISVHMSEEVAEHLFGYLSVTQEANVLVLVMLCALILSLSLFVLSLWYTSFLISALCYVIFKNLSIQIHISYVFRNLT